MWITIQSFDQGMVKGILNNSPEDVSSLSLGAHVEVKESAIADYL